VTKATAAATRSQAVTREHGNAYNIFMLVLTLASLLVMAVLLLPIDEDTRQLLNWYDNAICVIFLGDFVYNLTGSRPRSEYFVRQRGWLDLLGSIPTLGVFQLTALFRLARLSRLARIARFLSGGTRRELVNDVIRNRGQYATFITLLSAATVLSTASVLVLEVESRTPDSNIKTAGDAIWWGFVTITTVGYGDRFPVTAFGRVVAVLVMLSGIGIIGALASILASLLVTSSDDEEQAEEPVAAAGQEPSADTAAILSELAELRADVAALRESVAPR